MMDRPLQVVRIIARLNVGGPAKHVGILDAGLRRRRYSTLLLHGRPGRDEGSLAHLVLERELRATLVEALGRQVRPGRDLRAFWTIARLIFTTRPDIVHTHTTKAGVVGRLAALLYNATHRRSRRCLVVHTYHGTVFHGYFGWAGSLLVRAVERMLGWCTDGIAVLSKQQYREIVEGVRVAPGRKVEVVPLGLDLDPLLRIDASSPTLRCELGLADNAVVLGFVGRLVEIKDPATLLRAFERVRARVPSAMLLLAGDGPLRPATQALAVSLRLAGAVRFLGWRHDLPALYATVDAVVLSSRNEGTPVAAIEGMAAARPVVATDVGGVGDVIDHEETGLLVPPGSPAALAAAVERVATDATARQRLGAAARRVAAARFSAARLVDDVDRWYRAGLAAKRGAAASPPMTSLLVLLAAAFLVGLALVPACRVAARRLGCVAAPRSDRWHSVPTPLMGGVAVGVTIFGLMPVTGQTDGLWPVLACVGAMGVLGLVDDVRSLKPWTKLVVQIAVAAALVYFGYRLHWVESLTGDTLLSLFWIVGITNAFNLLDNMDGLCAGVAVIAAASLLATYGGALHHPDAAYLALLIGACSAFLVYNFSPASVFLGDAGTLLIGASLAAITLDQGSDAPGRPDVLAVVAVPAFVLLIPIFDTALVTVSRLLSGRAPSTGGRDHSSHRLVTIGLSERQAVAVLWGLAAAGGSLGVLTRYVAPDWSLLLGALFLLAMALFAVYLIQIRVYEEDDAALPSSGRVTPMLRRVVYQTRVAEVALDTLLVAVAYYAAYRLRFEGDAWGANFPIFLESLPIVVAVQMLALVVTGAYRGVWRHFGLVDAVVCLRSVAAGAVSVVVVLLFAFRFASYSRTVFVVYGLLLLLLLVASRASFRLLGEFFRRRRETGQRVVVYRAGDAGVIAVQEFVGQADSASRMMGFIDDDAAQHGRRVRGHRVLGGYETLRSLVQAGDVDTVVLCAAAVDAARLPTLKDLCTQHQVELLRLNVSLENLLAGRGPAE